jgi:hypothetical protein
MLLKLSLSVATGIANAPPQTETMSFSAAQPRLLLLIASPIVLSEFAGQT